MLDCPPVFSWPMMNWWFFLLSQSVFSVLFTNTSIYLGVCNIDRIILFFNLPKKKKRVLWCCSPSKHYCWCSLLCISILYHPNCLPKKLIPSGQLFNKLFPCQQTLLLLFINRAEKPLGLNRRNDFILIRIRFQHPAGKHWAFLLARFLLFKNIFPKGGIFIRPVNLKKYMVCRPTWQPN